MKFDYYLLMGKEKEVSPGGSDILRHEAHEREWAPPEEAATEQIVAHLSRFVGAPETVFHEIISDLVHLDVHVVRPRRERNCWTLFTTGMSALPMRAPEGIEDRRHAELLIALPPDWNVDELAVSPPPPDLERWYWPIRWLKKLARLPHEYETWLGFGHTIPNGDPPQALAPDTKLCGWLLLPPLSIPSEARTLALADGRVVNFYSLHALFPEEMSLKLNKGTDALLDAFDAHGVSEVLDPGRQPCVRRKLFALF